MAISSLSTSTTALTKFPNISPAVWGSSLKGILSDMILMIDPRGQTRQRLTQQFFPPFYLPANERRVRRPQRFLIANGNFRIQKRLDIHTERGRVTLQFREIQLRNLFPLVRAFLDHGADGIVRLAVRDSLFDQILHDIDREKGLVINTLGNYFFLDLKTNKKPGQKPEYVLDFLHRLKQGRLVELHVAVVGQRQPLHQNQYLVKIAVKIGRRPADELQDIRILFMRHNRRPRAQRPVNIHKIEFARGP